MCLAREYILAGCIPAAMRQRVTCSVLRNFHIRKPYREDSATPSHLQSARLVTASIAAMTAWLLGGAAFLLPVCCAGVQRKLLWCISGEGLTFPTPCILHCCCVSSRDMATRAGALPLEHHHAYSLSAFLVPWVCSSERRRLV